MRRAITGVLAALILAVTAMPGSSTAEDQSPHSQPQAQQSPPTTPALRNGCQRLYTQAAFRHYAHRTYRRTHLSRKAKRHVLTMMRCQYSPKAERKMRKVRRAEVAARAQRARMYCGSPACNRELGRFMITRRFGSGAFGCIDSIVMSESKWRVDIYNTAGSGAYGIPQALPGSKMANAGPDWLTNPATQIRWLESYVMRFGGPCGAAAYRRTHGSY